MAEIQGDRGDSSEKKTTIRPTLDRMSQEVEVQLSGPASQTGETAPHKSSYLEKGVNAVTSLIITDEKKRDVVNHYGCEFIKTASLFGRGKIGMAATLLAYGADQANPDDQSKWGQAADFALGAAKGGTIKTLFAGVSRAFNAEASVKLGRTDFSPHIAHAPFKGILMGTVSRNAEAIFTRDTFSNPSKTWDRLKAENTNVESYIFDAALFTAGEGAFGLVNRSMGGKLIRHELASGMVMGGSFGAVNGSAGEIMRQKQHGQPIDWTSVAWKGALEGMVGAAGAGTGIKLTGPRMHARIERSLDATKHELGILAENMGVRKNPYSREFVVLGGKEQLNALAAKTEQGAMVEVKEVGRLLGFRRLGDRQKLYVQRMTDGPESINPAAAQADLIATCYPEKLAGGLQSKHLFAKGKGTVWLEIGEEGRLRVSQGLTPFDAFKGRTYRPFGRLTRLDGHDITMNVMGPLEVGSSRNPFDPASKQHWEEFDRQLDEAKKLGVDAVSTDVWWGVVEGRPGRFKWDYYDQVSNRILNKGLKWVPILSTHQLGGNVGDTGSIPLPPWIWNRLAKHMNSSNPDIAKFVSEQGNKSSEYISFWATDAAAPYYRRFMYNFQKHFTGKAPGIAEINVSLGPAGELRYPSYNAHDIGSGYPTRGALQAYSELARKSFTEWAVAKYGSEEKARLAWNDSGKEPIGPPSDAEGFFRRNDHVNTQYGRDFFDWYNQSLIKHGQTMMQTAIDVFGSRTSAFAGIDIGAKIPGVHWRIGHWDNGQIVLSDRMAELNAGLITTSRNDWTSDDAGRGYRPIVTLFKDLQLKSLASRLVPHFTALELPDGHEGPIPQAMPHTLARWVGQEMKRQGLVVKGENAVNWTLPDHGAWDRMKALLAIPNQDGYYHGLTFLRMSDVTSNPVARQRLSELIGIIHAAQQAQQAAPAGGDGGGTAQATGDRASAISYQGPGDGGTGAPWHAAASVIAIGDGNARKFRYN